MGQSQVDSARKCIENGGVVVDPKWLSRVSERLLLASRMLTEAQTAPSLLRERQSRDGILAAIDSIVSTVGRDLADTADSPSVSEVLSHKAPIEEAAHGAR